MAQQSELQELLLSLLGSPNVYFQPPASLQMVYPCIRYELDDIRMRHADNRPYNHTDRYKVTVIDRNPNSDIREKVAALPMCSFDRFFTADNLNHYVFNLFF